MAWIGFLMITLDDYGKAITAMAIANVVAGRRPVLVDIACKAGGASMGYHRAGFDVIGIDIDPQPRYPFRFIRADLRDLAARDLHDLGAVAVAASPPCKVHTRLRAFSAGHHVNLIPETRALLQATGLPYVIENVPGAPLLDPLVLCGSMFPELLVRRHRLFELGRFKIAQPACDHRGQNARSPGFPVRDKYTGGTRISTVVSVVGRGNGGGPGEIDLWRRAMGIPWMVERELNEAIPPLYTEWIGRELFAEVTR